MGVCFGLNRQGGSRVPLPVAARLRDDSGQVVHTMHIPRPCTKQCNFYPRDATLARVGLLAMALCPSGSVCLSKVDVLSKRMKESRWFWHGRFIPPILHCVIRKFMYLQNKGTSLWNFAPNSGLRKFRHGISIIEACYQLSLRKADAQSAINWTVVDQASL